MSWRFWISDKTVRKFAELPTYYQRQKCSPGILVSSIITRCDADKHGQTDRHRTDTRHDSATQSRQFIADGNHGMNMQWSYILINPPRTCQNSQFKGKNPPKIYRDEAQPFPRPYLRWGGESLAHILPMGQLALAPPWKKSHGRPCRCPVLQIQRRRYVVDQLDAVCDLEQLGRRGVISWDPLEQLAGRARPCRAP